MKMPFAILALVVFTLNGVAAFAVGPSSDALAKQAISPDPATAQTAITALRDQGPNGLDVLLSTYDADIKSHALAANAAIDGQTAPSSENWERIQHAIEGVSAQRDCQVSHLYWYTDMDKALAAAKASGKPILSLRMLGNLNEEYSCANSRFFRTTLYSNAEISKYLRDNFILYWKSVRPVPKITIDMGDGRKIVRTITGNSIHYILDSNGRPVDALPGLYGPKAFLTAVKRAHDQAMAVGPLTDADFITALLAYHNNAVVEVTAAWNADLTALGVAAVPTMINQPFSTGSVGSTGAVETNIISIAPPAAAVQTFTISKSTVESPMLSAMTAQTTGTGTLTVSGAATGTVTFTQPNPSAFRAGSMAIGKGRIETPMLAAGVLPTNQQLRDATGDQTWSKIAQRHAEDAALDAPTVALIARKNPDAVQANRMTDSKADVETPLVRELANLRRSIAEDTVRNEYLLHSKIHEWFIAAKAPVDLNAFNERVYAELFLTPSSDPWLGMVPADTYTGLDHNGLIVDKK